MYRPISFDSSPTGGRLDRTTRHWCGVLSGGPEALAQMTWNLNCYAQFRDAVFVCRKAREDSEMFPAAVVISKAKDGTLTVQWFDCSPLTGWADSDGWNCWGGEVLTGAISAIEADPERSVEPGAQYTATHNPNSPTEPAIFPTHPRENAWLPFGSNPRLKGRYDS